MDQLQLNAQTERRADPPAPEICFIKLKQVLAICGISRTSIYDAIKKGEFPTPVKPCGRSSVWVKSEIIEWAQACIKASRAK